MELECKKERALLFQLAPTGRDPVYRLQQNGLPLGVKRVSWGHPTQRNCPHFQEVIETARPLFWNWSYSCNSWRLSCTPWKNKGANEVNWPQVITGIGILASIHDVVAPKIWAIVCECMLRAIRLERNLRVFLPDESGKQRQTRANQAVLDIQPNIESSKWSLPISKKEKFEKHIRY